jgi:hypothetical protein
MDNSNSNPTPNGQPAFQRVYPKKAAPPVNKYGIGGSRFKEDLPETDALAPPVPAPPAALQSSLESRSTPVPAPKPKNGKTKKPASFKQELAPIIEEDDKSTRSSSTAETVKPARRCSTTSTVKPSQDQENGKPDSTIREELNSEPENNIGNANGSTTPAAVASSPASEAQQADQTGDDGEGQRRDRRSIGASIAGAFRGLVRSRSRSR